MQHTPGPWGVHFDEDANQFQVFHDEGRGFGPMLATIIGVRGAFSANARLIAAAPELLAACQFALDIAEGRTPGTWDDVMIEMRRVIRAALT